MPMPVPSRLGLMKRKFHTFFEWLVNTLETLEFGSGEVVPGEDALGHRFVER